jgi:hypothetical protein
MERGSGSWGQQQRQPFDTQSGGTNVEEWEHQLIESIRWHKRRCQTELRIQPRIIRDFAGVVAPL